MSEALPKISIAGLRCNGAARKAELARLREAAEGIGFFLATDCEADIALALEDKAFEQARALFNLPQASLRKIVLDRATDPTNPGHEGLGAQSLDPRGASAKRSWNHIGTGFPSPRDPTREIGFGAHGMDGMARFAGAAVLRDAWLRQAPPDLR